MEKPIIGCFYAVPNPDFFQIESRPSDLLRVIGTCLALWIEWVESKENTNALQCSNSKSRLQLIKSRVSLTSWACSLYCRICSVDLGKHNCFSVLWKRNIGCRRLGLCLYFHVLTWNNWMQGFQIDCQGLPGDSATKWIKVQYISPPAWLICAYYLKDAVQCGKVWKSVEKCDKVL